MVDRRAGDELDGFLTGAGAGRDPLAVWLADVRRAVATPPPAPRGELARMLATDLSTEKGDLPATAVSNVTGPATQAAGLPKWRKRRMIGTHGLLPGLTGKLAGLGVPAKAVMALGLATTTVTGAAAATGSLPGPAQQAVATVVNAVSPLDIPTGDQEGSLVAGVELGGSPGAGAHVDAGTGDRSASVDATGSAPPGSGGAASADRAAGTAVTPPSQPPVPGAPDLPSIPGLPDVLKNLPVEIPDCASSIIDPATGNLLVVPSELASKVLGCVKSMVPAGTIPASVTQCLTSVLNSVQGVLGGGVPSGVPSIDISSCAPVDVSPCVRSVLGQAGTNPMAIVSRLGSFTDLANLFDVDDLNGCVPVSAAQCVSSILGSFRSGDVRHVDLSACLPTSTVGRA